MRLPEFAVPVLTMFQPAFSTPTYRRFLVLSLGALMTTGRRTSTHLLRTVRHHANGHASSYPRVLSQRRRSTWALARLLLAFLLTDGVPPGPVLLAGEDTVAERPGPHVFGKARHRDGGRSTHRCTAYRWGHTWVVVSVLIKLPFAARPWALPVLVALHRSPDGARAHGTRHKTPAHPARLLRARLVRRFPARQFIVVADTGYGTSEAARFCREHGRHLTVVSKCYRDAALYAPPPPRPPSTIGRPRVKGEKLAPPPEVVARTTQRLRLTGAWSGGSARDVEAVTGTGHWYRIGEALVEVRWGSVPDGTGSHRDAERFTTAITMRPQQIVGCYTQRRSIATTFHECREHLKLESTKGYGQQTAFRRTPCLLGLDPAVALRSLQLPKTSSTRRAVFGKGETTATFSDMMTCVRRASCEQWYFHTPDDRQPFANLSPSLQEAIPYALAPAA